MAEDPIAEALKFDPALKSKPSVSSKEGDEIDAALKFDPGSKTSEEPKEESKEPETKATWSQALVEGFQNIPSSAWETGKSMVEPIIHPVETGKAVGRLAAGAAQKLTPGKGEYEKDFDAVIEMYKRRYGGIEEFKKSLAKDPVGVLADAATLFTGAGTAVRGVGVAGKVGKLAKAGEAVAQAGAAMEPLNVARAIAAIPLKLVPEKVPIKMYESAVKFGTTLSMQERHEVTRTALKAANQIMPTERGMKKLRGMIDDINQDVNDLLNTSTQSGTQIRVGRLFKGIKDLKDEIKRSSDQPASWEKAFDDKLSDVKDMIKIDPNRTPQEIQKIKTSIYKELETLYEQHASSPAKGTIRKAIARNARENLEIIIPEIKQLNKNEGALIELWDAIESKANRITNRDFLSIGLPIKMGTGSGIGYMLGGPQGAAIGTAIGFTIGIYDTPQIKSKIALVVSRLGEKGITVKPSMAAVRLGLYETGKLELGGAEE